LKKILIFILFVSCSSPNSLNESFESNFDFNKNLSFDDFDKLLNEYSKQTPYPNLNE
jgi:hypothetical protein